MFLVSCFFFYSEKSYSCYNSPCFCIQIDESGRVIYNWSNSNFPFFSFYEHQFFADTGNGFVNVGSLIDSSQSFFVIPNYSISNYNSQFFIKTTYGGSNSLINFSDTISFISLDLVDNLDGTVSLSWNHPIPYDSVPLTAYYLIEKSIISSTAWDTVAILPKDSLSFTDHIGGCALSINYRVKLVVQDCEFISNIDGGNIEDQQAPDPPILLSVSNDTLSNFLLLNWLPSIAQDVSAYIIFKFSGSWSPIDTVYGYNSTTYIDSNLISFQNSVVQYAVAAMDSCSFGSPSQNNTSSAGLEHQNILLSKEFNACSREVKLSWNSYINFEDDLKYYEIFYKNDISSWTLLDTTQDLEYTYFITEGDMNYSFLIKAVDNYFNNYSLSNKIDFYANQAVTPQLSYISSVNVGVDTVIVTYFSENNIGISNVNLYRSTDNGDTFGIIDSKQSPVFPILFYDLEADYSKRSYLYKVSVTDSCGNEVAFSNLGSSIFLENDGDFILINNLKWNPYYQWQYGVENYQVFLNNNLNGGFQLISTLDSSESSFFHYFENQIAFPFDGKQCYKVIANETINDFGISSQSMSNELCIQHPPLAYVPNALNINGLNNQWKPIINMIDFSEMKVSIYNRNGELIFYFTDSNGFWDGSIMSSGEIAPNGIYVYLIEIKNNSNQSFIKKGNITLLY
tara:strand:+ start:21562 stop:23601 length:2040 start_codon:yes stop_codon:yes gene_type:complete